jgi:glutamine synthetase
MKIILDYIWLDGNTISDVCYLTKIVDVDVRKYNGIQGYLGKLPRQLDTKEDIDKIPTIKIDGSMTNQEPTNDDMVTLKPVSLYLNPLRNNSYYVVCEVYDGKEPHISNSRHSLKEIIHGDLESTTLLSLTERFIVFEEDGVLFTNNKKAYISSNSFGEDVISELLDYIIKMNLSIEDIINKYDKNGAWELKTNLAPALNLSDDIVILRHLLYRLSIKHNKKVSFSRKYFEKINLEKDEINDPYLLTKKMLKSYL